MPNDTPEELELLQDPNENQSNKKDLETQDTAISWEEIGCNYGIVCETHVFVGEAVKLNKEDVL